MLEKRSHRKLVKHYHEPGDLHELTFSCYRRVPLLTNDRWREWLSAAIDSAGEKTGIRLTAFVYMPEHVHLLVAHPAGAPAISRYLSLIKRPVSKAIKTQLLETQSPLIDRLTVQERPGITRFRFWQEGPGFDRNLNSPADIEVSIDYLHRNPCRRGFVERAVDWKWSSARWYLFEPPRQHIEGLPVIHGLPAGALDS
jgi:putative transposase